MPGMGGIAATSSSAIRRGGRRSRRASEKAAGTASSPNCGSRGCSMTTGRSNEYAEPRASESGTASAAFLGSWLQQGRNFGRQFFVGKVARMIQPYNAPAVHQHQRRSRAYTELQEIFLAHRHAHPGRDGVLFLILVLQVRHFLIRGGVFSMIDVAVKLGRSDYGQTLAAEILLDAGEDRHFSLAVSAPVRPEEEQHDLSFQFGQSLRLFSDPARHSDRGRRLALEAQQ